MIDIPGIYVGRFKDNPNNKSKVMTRRSVPTYTDDNWANVDLNLLEVINTAEKLGAQSYHYNLNQEGFAIEDFGKVGQEMIDMLGLDPKREVLGCIVFDRDKV